MRTRDIFYWTAGAFVLLRMTFDVVTSGTIWFGL